MHYNKFPNELWNYSIKKLLSQFEKRLEVLDFYIIKYQILILKIAQFKLIINFLNKLNLFQSMNVNNCPLSLVERL